MNNPAQRKEIEAIAIQLQLSLPTTILDKATEISRRLCARSWTSQLKQMSQILPILCLDLSCSLKETPFPRQNVYKRYRISQNDYLEKREFLINSIQLSLPTPSASQLCVKFGCSHIRDSVEYLKNQFLSTLTGKSISTALEKGALEATVFLICYSAAGSKLKKDDQKEFIYSSKLLSKYDRLVRESCSQELSYLMSRLTASAKPSTTPKRKASQKESHSSQEKQLKRVHPTTRKLEANKCIDITSSCPIVEEKPATTIMNVVASNSESKVTVSAPLNMANATMTKQVLSSGINLMIYRGNVYTTPGYKEFLTWKASIISK